MSVALVDDLQPDAQSHDLAETQEVVANLLALEQAGALTATSLELPADLDYDTYSAIGRFLGELHKRSAWFIGDWLIFGEGTYGERFAQAAAETGLSEHTLQNRMWVCRAIPPNRRRREVSFSGHALVAGMQAREQRQWLRMAADGGWTRAELDSKIRESRRTQVEASDREPSPRGEVMPDLLLDAAKSLVANAQDAGENVIVRREDFARVRAALGEED